MLSKTVKLTIGISLLSLGMGPLSIHHGVAVGEPLRTISICDLFRDLPRLEGRIVKVRGLFEVTSPKRGNEYFDELVPENCGLSDQQEIRIKISSPDVHFLQSPPPGYKPDMASIRRADREVEKRLNQGKTIKRLVGTVEGVVYSSEGDTRPQDSLQKPQPHKRYPAYIIIQAIRDVRVY